MSFFDTYNNFIVFLSVDLSSGFEIFSDVLKVNNNLKLHDAEGHRL